MVNYCCIKYEVKFNLDYFFLYDEYFDEKVVLECFYIIWWIFFVNRIWVFIKFIGIIINLLDENWDKNKIFFLWCIIFYLFDWVFFIS